MYIMEKDTEMKKQNLIYIDVLKVFAMLGVVLVHFTQNLSSGIEIVDSVSSERSASSYSVHPFSIRISVIFFSISIK